MPSFPPALLPSHREKSLALSRTSKALASGPPALFEGAFQDRARRLASETDSDYVREVTDFILGASDRSFLTPG